MAVYNAGLNRTTHLKEREDGQNAVSIGQIRSTDSPSIPILLKTQSINYFGSVGVKAIDCNRLKNIQ